VDSPLILELPDGGWVARKILLTAKACPGWCVDSGCGIRLDSGTVHGGIQSPEDPLNVVYSEYGTSAWDVMKVLE
jgi:hypothetical protein